MWSTASWLKHFEHVKDRYTSAEIASKAIDILNEHGPTEEYNTDCLGDKATCVQSLSMHRAEMVFLMWLEINHPNNEPPAKKPPKGKPVRKPQAHKKAS